MSRLQIPASVNVNIWNIPSPHTLASPAFDTRLGKPLSGRLTALDLDPDHTTGISFFISSWRIIAIHGHTKRGSQALEAFQYLCRFRKVLPDWVYIPITAKDKVLEIGTVRNRAELLTFLTRRVIPTIGYSIAVSSLT